MIMLRKFTFFAIVIFSFIMLSSQQVFAGAKLKINEDSSIDLGFRVQAMYLSNDKDHSPNRNEFRLRRARFRLKGNISKKFTGFLQTDTSNESGNDSGVGQDMRLIDAWIMYKFHKLAMITGGMHMPAVARQNLTSSGALMCVDRPGINNYILGWGQSGREAFNTGTLGGTKSGLTGNNDVRDLGFSLFGSSSLSDIFYLKYYLGVFEGATSRLDAGERFTGRVQINLWDAEPGYFNLSTYVGKKRTMGFGIGFDTQNNVANDLNTGQTIDYNFLTLDYFLDIPMGGNLTITTEAAYSMLDLDNAGILQDGNGDVLSTVSASQSQGDGFYLQTGVLVGKWQPWVMYEQWNSDGVADAGSWDAFRFGGTYFWKGHNTNFKAGYEIVNNRTPGEPGINTFAFGMYMTY